MLVYRDRHKVEVEHHRLLELVAKGVLPESYDVHNSLILQPGHIIDTTERSTVQLARDFRFDPDGYDIKHPLEREIFYKDPYITCSACNTVMFVNVAVVRYLMATPIYEQLPTSNELITPCSCCHRSDSFVVGPHDFTEEIKERAIERRRQLEREATAAALIQRMYRWHLRLLYGSAMAHAVLAERRLHYKAATRVNATARGRLDRRRARTERLLVRIKYAHTTLIRLALKESPARKKLFWYTRRDDLRMVFDNYVDFVERTGHQPVRMVVEQNIKELAERITEIAHSLLRLIQCRWRGVMARRVVAFFRTEVIRIRQYEAAQAMKIQRMVRGHACRLKAIPRLKQTEFQEKLMQMYIRERRETSAMQNKRDANNLIQVNYQRERAKEATLRMTSRIRPPADYNGKKMLACSSSCYAETYLQEHIAQSVSQDVLELKGEEAQRKYQRERKLFILQRIAETGPSGMGLRSIPSPPPAVLHNKIGSSFASSHQSSISSTQNALVARRGLKNEIYLECSRSRGMRAYFRDELERIIRGEIDFVTHDFSQNKNKCLTKRFQEFNSGQMSGGKKMMYKYPANLLTGALKGMLENDEESHLVEVHKQRVNKRHSIVKNM